MRRPASIVLAALLAAACQQSATSSSVRDDVDALADSQGARLYAEHCSICHGPDGSGQGRAELFPPARNFRRGRFRIVSAANGAPTDDDLMRVLERGLPGSAMPSFVGLTVRDRELLVRYVRALAIEGLAEDIEDDAQRMGDSMTPEDARDLAVERMTPHAIVSPPPATGEPDLAHGRELFLAECARCHGEDGHGRENVPRVNEDGRLDWARDFTAGYLEGGASREDLWRRIVIGLPGSAMPASSLTSPEDLDAVIAYVQTLIPPGSEEAHVQKRRTIEVRRVAAIPDSLDSAIWTEVPSTRIALAPLVWNANEVESAMLSAVHDGEQIAVCMSWKDDTLDSASIEGDVRSDGCALQLSSATAPPLFGMGSASSPTNVWHWKAFEFEDVAGLLDLTQRPHRVLDDPLREPTSVVDAPYVLMPGPSDVAESVRTTGPDSMGSATRDSLPMHAYPRYADGEWKVVFVRDLATRSKNEITLEPGHRVQVAFAVWNGSAGDHDGRKSISVWHELALAP